jgi:hypothetical protein
MCLKVEAQREHFDNLGLHIGYIYGDNEIPASASLYTPSYRAGARLPHAWLSHAPLSPLPQLPPIDNSYVSELSPTALTQKQFSTLDLCAFDRFTLICSSKFSLHWLPLLYQLQLHLPKRLKIASAILGRDFELVPGARKNEWIMGLQLEHGGAVLVRPDQHILNCYTHDTKFEALKRDLKGHLGF